MSSRTQHLPLLLLVGGISLGPLGGAEGGNQASSRDEFNRKAAGLFHRTHFFHDWRETDHVVDGEDWSLPPGVKAAPWSAWCE